MSRQAGFRAGLLDATAAPPGGLSDGQGRPAGRRYDVYRNNVTHSLIEALATAFPLVRKLIGPENFEGLARIHVRANPPKSPVMMFYGADFPDFLAQVEGLKRYPYLPDAARLDLALRHAYHAADAPPFKADSLAALTPEALAEVHLKLAPATRLVPSPWPLHDIWRYSLVPGAPKPGSAPQDVLVTRPAYDPAPHALPPGGLAWFQALARGAPLGAAQEAALEAAPDFDLETTLGLALATGALTTNQP